MPVDTIVFAVIALIVLYRLYLTLGDRTGFDPEELAKNKQSDNLKKNTPSNFEDLPKDHHELDKLDPYIRTNVMNIVKIDPQFRIDEFLQGATTAYEMTLAAYAQENLTDLKNLLSPNLYDAFKVDIKQRQNQGEIYENTLIKLDDAVIVDAKINGSVAQITVKFTSEQVPIFKNKQNEIIRGNPDQIDQVIDHWIFERSLKSANPNWVITETDA